MADFTANLGQEGQGYPQKQATHVVDTTINSDQVANATADLTKSQAEAVPAAALARSGQMFAEAASIFANTVSEGNKQNLRTSLTGQLAAMEKGLQLEGVKDSFTGAALNDPSVRAAYTELTSIKALRDQGYSNEASVKLRAEAILKKYINSAPAFAREIRRIAAETIGFDPLGTQLKMLAGIGQKVEKTPEQKGMEAFAEAQTKATLTLRQAYPNASPSEIQHMIAHTTQLQQQSANLQNNLLQNNVALSSSGMLNRKVSDDVGNQVGMSIGTFSTRVNSIIQQNPDHTLHPDQVSTLKYEIQQEKIAYTNKMLASAQFAGESDKTAFRTSVEQRYAQLEGLIDSGDMEKLTTKVLNTVPKAQAVKMMSQSKELLNIMTLSKEFGLNDAQSLIAVSNQFIKLPREQLQKIDPKAAAVMDSQDAAEMTIKAGHGIITGSDMGKDEDPGKNFVKLNISKGIVSDPGTSPMAKANALQTIKNIKGTVGLLQVYDDIKTQNAVRSDPQSATNFRNIFTSSVALTQDELKSRIAGLRSQGVVVNISDTGSITVDGARPPEPGSPEFNKEQKKWQSSQDFLASPAVKQYAIIQKLAHSYSDILNLGVADKFTSDLNKELLSAPERSSSTSEPVKTPVSTEELGSITKGKQPMSKIEISQGIEIPVQGEAIGRVANLNPGVAPKIRAIIDDLKEQGFNPVVASGTRTEKEQAEKVRLGYSKTMNSKHLHGNAVDIVDGGKGWDSSPEFWAALGKAARKQGLEWGGDWKTFKDVAHVQFNVQTAKK